MRNNKLQLCFQDIILGMKNWRVWLLLSWQDIFLRYRQSVVGPLWITFSLFIRIFTIGILYSYLLRTGTARYMPSLAIGMLVWSLISGIVNEGTVAFLEGSGYLKQIKMPYTVFVMRMVMRNIIIFLHNIIAVIPFILFYHVHLHFNLIEIIPGVIIIIFNGYVFGYIFAIFGARFRDIQQVVISLMQVIYFATPIMWMPSLLPTKHQWIVTCNVFAQFIALIRDPLMGQAISPSCIYMTLASSLIGFVFLIVLLYRIRHRIIYWL